MKKVTFFTRNIVDGIEYTDNFEFREEEPHYKNDLIYLKGVKDFFDIYDIKYETYNGSNVGVDYAYLAWADELSLKISDLTDRWYPKAVNEKLIRKDMMPEYLKQFGFNCLDTKKINSVDDVSGNNFIIKPIIGSGGKNGRRISLDHLDPKFKDQIFSYKPYSIVGEFLKDINLDSDISQFRKKSDAIFQTKDPRNGYCIQRACMSPQYEIYTIYGVVNSNSDVYFTRAGITWWKDSKTYIESKCWKQFYNEIPENEFIRNFVKIEKIRNAAFALQLIRMEDGLLYPIDWNFRIKPKPPKLNNRIEELYKMLCHMYDIENDLPETWPDIWIMQHNPKKYNRA